MKRFAAFLLGVIFGVAFSVGVLAESGHLVAETSKAAIEYTVLDGFSIK